MTRRSRDFESRASASFTTPARREHLFYVRLAASSHAERFWAIQNRTAEAIGRLLASWRASNVQATIRMLASGRTRARSSAAPRRAAARTTDRQRFSSWVATTGITGP